MGTVHDLRDTYTGARRGARDKPRSTWLRAARGLGPILVLLPLAAFTAVFLAGGPPDAGALEQPRAAYPLVETHFVRCGFGPRVNCVVDGDTIWLAGEKIRIADINTPEVGEPQCDREAELGERATLRLTDLLNNGAFTLAPNPDGRDTDRYGRKLRVLTRNGASLGETLVAEGLAHEWRGRREGWC